MKNIFKMLLNYGKERAVISDKSIGVCKAETRIAAKRYYEAIEIAIKNLQELNELLNNPLVEFNGDKHLMLTMPCDLSDGAPLIILFCLDNNEPICAYFDD